MEMKELSKIKYLLWTYVNKLNWKYHIEDLTILVRTFFNIFRTHRLYWVLTFLKTVYYSLVTGKLYFVWYKHMGWYFQNLSY